MSAAFKSMSDLVADSEDLLARIGGSEIPQVRALMEPFRRSVDQLKAQLRHRAKQLHVRQSAVGPRTAMRYTHVWVAAFITIGTAAWLYNRGTRRS